MRFFIPIILIVAAIALFVVYTNPNYQNSKLLAAQNASYDDALTKSAQLHSIRDDLLAKRNAFSNNDISRLEYILPDNVDNIRLIIDINNIALKNGLALTDVSLGDIVKNDPTAGQSTDDTTSAVGSVKVGFTVAASYVNFLSFLQDLEHSLRLIDVDKIDYQPGTNGGNGTYQVEVETYWLH
jgi:Tfp pilus assembly protein PilO